MSVDLEMDFESRYRIQAGNPSTGFYYEAFETINADQVDSNGKYATESKEQRTLRETRNFRILASDF